MRKNEKIAPILYKFFKVFDLGRSELIFGGCDYEEVGLFDFVEVDDIFIESDLNVSLFTL